MEWSTSESSIDMQNHLQHTASVYRSLEMFESVYVPEVVISLSSHVEVPEIIIWFEEESYKF